VKARAVERLRRKITIENLWLYVINILLEKPTYAYDVKKRIVEKFGFQPATITVYTVMYKMTREGLLEKDENGTYRVTEQGKRAYEEGLKILEETVTMLSGREA